MRSEIVKECAACGHTKRWHHSKGGCQFTGAALRSHAVGGDAPPCGCSTFVASTAPDDIVVPEPCAECNWTNVGLLNVGERDAPKWMCHGCLKRAVDRLAALDAGLRPSEEPDYWEDCIMAAQLAAPAAQPTGETTTAEERQSVCSKCRNAFVNGYVTDDDRLLCAHCNVALLKSALASSQEAGERAANICLSCGKDAGRDADGDRPAYCDACHALTPTDGAEP